jgi:Domain of unknown function (DUF1906)
MRSLGNLLLAGALFCCAFLLCIDAVRSNTPAQKAYLGFDANGYPGDDGLPILRKTFAFSSYWLSPPPGEKATSWLGKRSTLQAQGFGFVVLWNGRDSHNLKSSDDAQRKGKLDAQNAAKMARQEGFLGGTIIFLDIEEGGRLGPAYHDYVHAWIDALTPENFRPGVYCSAMPVHESGGVSITTVDDIQSQLGGRKLVYWVDNDACPPAPGCAFPAMPPSPMKSGFAGAAVWQYAQSPRRKQFTAHCEVKYAPDGNCYAPGDTAHKWFIDANVADSPNPSAAEK